ncbi:CDP-glycerol--glycerophosphate glycerophosphotransferase, partial [Mammaliicoccus sciuri]
VDVFITSSEREKEIVVRDLKFDEAQVKVTGLARFDELFNKDIKTKNQILIMPTWRDWLTNYEQLESSEYLERMNTLINSDKVKDISEQGTKVIFCLHPNMQPFIDLFDVPQHVTSIKQGDVNVQQLIQESKLMITDYSSVAFDFSFLGKPVIYYQFDKDHFLGKEPSHINIEEELPGLIVNNQNDLEAQLTRIIANDYTTDVSVNIKAQRFNNFNDRHN